MSNHAEWDGDRRASVCSNETSVNSILHDSRGDIAYARDIPHKPPGGDGHPNKDDLKSTDATTGLASFSEYVQTRQGPFSMKTPKRRARRSDLEIEQGYDFMKARLDSGMTFESIREEYNNHFGRTRSVDDIRGFWKKGPPPKKRALVVLNLPPALLRDIS